MKTHLHRMILLAGLGNTGSHLAPLIARAGLCDFLVLVDPDIVEQKNMRAQAYELEDVGQPKASVMTKRLSALGLNLGVQGFVGELEDLPYGYFGDAVVLCLDHDAARQSAAERAWRMGAILFDVAVNGQAGLARVTRIIPGVDRACLECGFSENQYANLLARHSCRKAPSTNSPAALGSFAGSLAAMQLRSPVKCECNTEIVAAPGTGEMWVSRLTPNKSCRFPHAAPPIGRIEPIDFSAPFESLFSLLDTVSVEVLGASFAGKWRCVGCGVDHDHLTLDRGPLPACPLCGTLLGRLPFYSCASITRDDFIRCAVPQSLSAVGLRPGDVVRTHASRCMQLGSLPVADSIHPCTNP